jgi:hypothetical protein
VFRKLASRRDCIPDLAPIHHYLRQLIETIFEILLIDCFDAAYEVLPDPPTLITGRVLVMEAEPDSDLNASFTVPIYRAVRMAMPLYNSKGWKRTAKSAL